MAVSYVIHDEFQFPARGKTILTFRDMTLTLSGDEGGGENPLEASELGFKTVLFCSNGRNGGEIVIAGPTLAGSGIAFWYKPGVTDGTNVSMTETAYNGDVRLVVIGTI